MKQIRITAPYTFKIENTAIPAAKMGQVILKISHIGVCGSDMQIYHGKHKFMTFPVILGHEVAATVHSVGQNVSDFSVGDKVTVEPQITCGKCYPCETGSFNVCEQLKVFGVHLDGFSSEYTSIDTKYLHKVPQTMPGELITLVEPLAVGTGAVRRAGDIKGANVVIVGAGTIGNFTAQAVKALGAHKVMITDINQKKLDYALECGIDESVNTKETTLKDAIFQRLGSKKADIIIDCAGSPFTFKSIIEAARPASKIIITANFKEPVEFSVPIVQRQEISILGHMMYNNNDFRTAIDLLANKKIVTKKTITKVFGFDEYQRAFEYADADPDSIMKLVISL